MYPCHASNTRIIQKTGFRNRPLNALAREAGSASHILSSRTKRKITSAAKSARVQGQLRLPVRAALPKFRSHRRLRCLLQRCLTRRAARGIRVTSGLNYTFERVGSGTARGNRRGRPRVAKRAQVSSFRKTEGRLQTTSLGGGILQAVWRCEVNRPLRLRPIFPDSTDPCPGARSPSPRAAFPSWRRALPPPAPC